MLFSRKRNISNYRPTLSPLKRMILPPSWSRRAAAGFVTSYLRPDPTSPPVRISLRSVCMR